MSRRSSSTHRCWLLLSLCAVALAAGCRRESAELPGAETGPASAVRQLAHYLKDDDLVGYARAAVPPAQYTRLEAAWSAGDSRWPLSELPLHQKLPGILATLSAADAETRLQRAFKTQIAGQAAGVRQAAHSLGLFGAQYLGSQGDYSAEQRAHYVQLVSALSEWAMAAPLSDPKLAQKAIGNLTAVARAAGLDSDAAFQQAGMSGSLQRLGPVLHGFKQVLASYGLSLDDSLTQLRAGLVVERGDQATVRVQYPLAGKELDIQVPLVRREGRWYLAQILTEVDTVLAAAAAAEAARGAAPPTADPAGAPDAAEKPAISSAKP
ncbi:hypothetical protein [Stenotrophomonas sp. YIM B06876]|uniref:hypothetical protein n=1 Tax=Stenotrophomonas sp. YIM B06876 TaxID=3060211 RepID=UPI00273947C0|nr:hypothetical protein [Stenotrophomonas sp. YIM B06876]